MMIIPESCCGCGKCCQWAQYKTVPEINLGAINAYYGKCQHLTSENLCTIYVEGRPDCCKTLERGSETCLIFLNNAENV